MHDAHWRIRTRPLVITGMTKLTRYHLLQLEGSSRALPFCRSLTTWQVCDKRRDAGGVRRNVVWYDNSAASASARRNPELRRAVAIDSLEIPSFYSGSLECLIQKTTWWAGLLHAARL